MSLGTVNIQKRFCGQPHDGWQFSRSRRITNFLGASSNGYEVSSTDERGVVMRKIFLTANLT